METDIRTTTLGRRQFFGDPPGDETEAETETRFSDCSVLVHLQSVAHATVQRCVVVVVVASAAVVAVLVVVAVVVVAVVAVVVVVAAAAVAVVVVVAAAAVAVSVADPDGAARGPAGCVTKFPDDRILPEPVPSQREKTAVDCVKSVSW